ncbi:MAG: hypothetical protein ACK4MY_00995 [Brevundimonas sp.]
MLDAYNDYFEDRLDRLRGTNVIGDFILRSIPVYWRSDARYFLFSNLMDMVVRPVAAVRPQDRDSLFGYLEADIGKIREMSEDIAGLRGRDYVSATSVSMALGRLAPDLATTALQIWGRTASAPDPESQAQAT